MTDEEVTDMIVNELIVEELFEELVKYTRHKLNCESHNGTTYGCNCGLDNLIHTMDMRIKT